MGRGVLVLVAVFAVLACDASPYVDTQQNVERQPNIVLVLLDDVHPAMLKHMPNVRSELAARGTTFENAVNTYPLCCPSRATMQRGQYAHNTRVFGNLPKNGGGYPTFDGLDLEKSTVATWLQDSGYLTAHAGEYMNGFDSATPIPPGWDGFVKVSRDTPLPPGFDTPDSLTAHQAMVRLRGAAPESVPFFLQASFAAPHTPNGFESEYAGRFAGERVPRTPAYDEADVGDKPRYIRERKPPLRKQENPTVAPPCRDDERNSVRQNDCEWVRALRNLQTADAFVGDAVSYLAEQGELGNTYFFFYSDNGNHWGEHRLDYGKLAPYETDVGVPLVVRGPGVPEGAVSEKLIGNHDLAPTFAEIAGAPAPGFVDGRSFLRLVDGDGANDGPWRDALLVQRHWEDRYPKTAKPDNAYHVPPYGAVRYEDSIYVRYGDDPWTDAEDAGFEEFYDLGADPHQLRNAAFYGAVPEGRLADARARLDALKGCSGEGCREAEDAP